MGRVGFPSSSVVKQSACNAETKEMWFSSLDWEDLLEKGMVTHSSILARKIPRREESGRLQSILSQRVGHNWATHAWIGFLLGIWDSAMNKLGEAIDLRRGRGWGTRLLWVVRKGLWGEELAPNLGLEIACHFQTGEKIHQRNSKFEQLNDGQCD